ncbi:unnamed protein product [Adineta ricciae]|uniref:Uncharacterized protein n=1 Tax=Adineta ricciae TaxID=249248 RepID=A0A815K1N0_ADIRI|nr:unnamed protein product [Adineta ricciae]CAF1649171.1 unnamed protein product [Adineta ricciae]
MTSSYYPITTDNYFDKTHSKAMTSTSHYNSYHPIKATKRSYSDDDDDDDLDALRNAALKTLNSRKRKNTHDHSPIRRESRSPSQSYSSRSGSSYSSISRSSSSSSLSSISSDSIDRHDKDYRFENKEKQATGDIDERFPQDIPTANDDTLILDCPFQDDDLLLHQEDKPTENSFAHTPLPPPPPRKSSTRNDQNHHKSSTKDTKPQKKEERRHSSPVNERPVSITVKLNTDEFDLRHLIKKRRTEESSQNNHRTVQILQKDRNNTPIIHRSTHDRHSDKSRSSHRHHKH